MKKLATWAIISCAVIAGIVIAADHQDAPAVDGQPTDIADFYAFEGNDSNSTVFIVTTPAASAEAMFDENVLFEINIDNTGASDGVVEDLVIQAIRQGDEMYFFGPYAPVETGLNSTINEAELVASVNIGETEEVGGMKFFAGQRQDAFFFDFNAFNNVVANAPIEGFGDSGTNAFESANVNAIVVEIPNSMLGTAPTHIVDELLMRAPTLPEAYNVWVTTSTR